MKGEHIDIDKMVMESHYLHALDIEDNQSASSLPDMERQDYIDIITSQKETIDQLKGMLSDLRDMIKSLESKLSARDESEAKYKEQILSLTSQVADLTSALNIALEQQSRMKKERYGRTAQNNRNKKSSTSKKSREEEKDDYDGSDSNSSSENESSSQDTAPDVDQAKVTSEFLDNPRVPRGPYTTMDAACVIEHKTDIMPITPKG